MMYVQMFKKWNMPFHYLQDITAASPDVGNWKSFSHVYQHTHLLCSVQDDGIEKRQCIGISNTRTVRIRQRWPLGFAGFALFLWFLGIRQVCDVLEIMSEWVGRWNIHIFLNFSFVLGKKSCHGWSLKKWRRMKSFTEIVQLGIFTLFLYQWTSWYFGRACKQTSTLCISFRVERREGEGCI